MPGSGYRYMNGGTPSGKMAGSEQSSKRWIADEEQIHRSAEYGSNLRAVNDALDAQRERNNLVIAYEKDVNRLPKDTRETVINNYDTLRVVSEKRLSCLEDIAKIAGLEDLLGKLSVEFATKASSLVASDCNRHENIPENAGDGVKAAAQNCILAVRDNWQWISKLVRCTDNHLKNSSEYHEFFHEVKENEAWMPVELRAAQNKVKLNETTEGTNKEGQRWLLDIKELLTLFLHWQGKLEKLFARSSKIVPVHLRTQKLDYFRPVESLVAYKTNEIDVREGEELLLINNANTQSWLVRNHNSVESKVPSVICLIPGPDPDAIQAAMRLRLQLLTEWTQNIKRVGKSLILYNILILKDWNDDEIKKLQAIPKDKKAEIVRILEFVLEALRPHWSGYAGFKELERRVGIMKDILRKEGNPKDRDQDFERDLLARLGSLEELFKNYNTMWSQWEAYKILVEASRHADNLLIVDKWEQLKFIPMDELRRLWQQSLEFGDGDNLDFESWLKRMMELWSKKFSSAEPSGGQSGEDIQRHLDELEAKHAEATRRQEELLQRLASRRQQEAELKEQAEREARELREREEREERERRETEMLKQHEQEMVTTSEETYLQSGREFNAVEGFDEFDEGMLGEGRNGFEEAELETTTQSSASMETATTDQVTHAEQEEKKTFVITGVIDPRSGEEVSMHQAVMLGIINSQEGTYVNPDTGKSVPIPQAMSEGHIKVEFTSTRKGQEKRRDIGLITIRTQRESRPYTVQWVIDAETDAKLSVDDAIRRRILDQKNGIYYNTLTKQDMSLADALDTGLLVVEYDNSVAITDPEVVSKTYSIHGVVDQRRRNKVSFTEAVRAGLLNKETGAYYHNVNHEYIYVGDAIKRGFIKASLVKDPNSLDIDPENRVVVETVETMKRKLLNPLKTMAAFKKAAGVYLEPEPIEIPGREGRESKNTVANGVAEKVEKRLEKVNDAQSADDADDNTLDEQGNDASTHLNEPPNSAISADYGAQDTALQQEILQQIHTAQFSSHSESVTLDSQLEQITHLDSLGSPGDQVDHVVFQQLVAPTPLESESPQPISESFVSLVKTQNDTTVIEQKSESTEVLSQEGQTLTVTKMQSQALVVCGSREVIPYPKKEITIYNSKSFVDQLNDAVKGPACQIIREETHIQGQPIDAHSPSSVDESSEVIVSSSGVNEQVLEQHVVTDANDLLREPALVSSERIEQFIEEKPIETISLPHYTQDNDVVMEQQLKQVSEYAVVDAQKLEVLDLASAEKQNHVPEPVLIQQQLVAEIPEHPFKEEQNLEQLPDLAQEEEQPLEQAPEPALLEELKQEQAPEPVSVEELKQEQSTEPPPVEERKEEQAPEPAPVEELKQELAPELASVEKLNQEEELEPVLEEEMKEEQTLESALVEELKQGQAPEPVYEEELKHEQSLEPAPLEQIKEKQAPEPAPVEELKEEHAPEPAPVEELNQKLEPELASVEKLKQEHELEPVPVEDMKEEQALEPALVEELKQEQAPEPVYVEKLKQEQSPEPAPVEQIKEEQVPEPAPVEKLKKEQAQEPAPVEELKQEQAPQPAPVEEQQLEQTPEPVPEEKLKTEEIPQPVPVEELIIEQTPEPTPIEELKQEQTAEPAFVEEMKQEQAPEFVEEVKKEPEEEPAVVQELNQEQSPEPVSVEELKTEQTEPAPVEEMKQEQAPEPTPIEELKTEQAPEPAYVEELKTDQAPAPVDELKTQQEPEPAPVEELNQNQTPELAAIEEQEQEPEHPPVEVLDTEQAPELAPVEELKTEQGPEPVPVEELKIEQAPEPAPLDELETEHKLEPAYIEELKQEQILDQAVIGEQLEQAPTPAPAEKLKEEQAPEPGSLDILETKQAPEPASVEELKKEQTSELPLIEEQEQPSEPVPVEEPQLEQASESGPVEELKEEQAPEPARVEELDKGQGPEPTLLEELNSEQAAEPAYVEELTTDQAPERPLLEELDTELALEPAPVEELKADQVPESVPVEEQKIEQAPAPAPLDELETEHAAEPVPVEELKTEQTPKPAPLDILETEEAPEPAPVKELETEQVPEPTPVEELKQEQILDQSVIEDTLEQAPAPAPLDELETEHAAEPVPVEEQKTEHIPETAEAPEPAPVKELEKEQVPESAPVEELKQEQLLDQPVIEDTLEQAPAPAPLDELETEHAAEPVPVEEQKTEHIPETAEAPEPAPLKELEKEQVPESAPVEELKQEQLLDQPVIEDQLEQAHEPAAAEEMKEEQAPEPAPLDILETAGEPEHTPVRELETEEALEPTLVEDLETEKVLEPAHVEELKTEQAPEPAFVEEQLEEEAEPAPVKELKEEQAPEPAFVDELKQEQEPENAAVEKQQLKQETEHAFVEELKQEQAPEVAPLEELKQEQAPELAPVEELKQEEAPALASVEELKTEEASEPVCVEELKTDQAPEPASVEELDKEQLPEPSSVVELKSEDVPEPSSEEQQFEEAPEPAPLAEQKQEQAKEPAAVEEQQIEEPPEPVFLEELIYERVPELAAEKDLKVEEEPASIDKQQLEHEVEPASIEELKQEQAPEPAVIEEQQLLLAPEVTAAEERQMEKAPEPAIVLESQQEKVQEPASQDKQLEYVAEPLLEQAQEPAPFEEQQTEHIADSVIVEQQKLVQINEPVAEEKQLDAVPEAADSSDINTHSQAIVVYGSREISVYNAQSFLEQLQDSVRGPACQIIREQKQAQPETDEPWQTVLQEPAIVEEPALVEKQAEQLKETVLVGEQQSGEYVPVVETELEQAPEPASLEEQQTEQVTDSVIVEEQMLLQKTKHTAEEKQLDEVPEPTAVGDINTKSQAIVEYGSREIAIYNAQSFLGQLQDSVRGPACQIIREQKPAEPTSDEPLQTLSQNDDVEAVTITTTTEEIVDTKEEDNVTEKIIVQKAVPISCERTEQFFEKKLAETISVTEHTKSPEQELAPAEQKEEEEEHVEQHIEVPELPVVEELQPEKVQETANEGEPQPEVEEPAIEEEPQPEEVPRPVVEEEKQIEQIPEEAIVEEQQPERVPEPADVQEQKQEQIPVQQQPQQVPEAVIVDEKEKEQITEPSFVEEKQPKQVPEPADVQEQKLNQDQVPEPLDEQQQEYIPLLAVVDEQPKQQEQITKPSAEEPEAAIVEQPERVTEEQQFEEALQASTVQEQLQKVPEPSFVEKQQLENVPEPTPVLEHILQLREAPEPPEDQLPDSTASEEQFYDTEELVFDDFAVDELEAVLRKETKQDNEQHDLRTESRVDFRELSQQVVVSEEETNIFSQSSGILEEESQVKQSTEINSFLSGPSVASERLEKFIEGEPLDTIEVPFFDTQSARTEKFDKPVDEPSRTTEIGISISVTHTESEDDKTEKKFQESYESQEKEIADSMATNIITEVMQEVLQNQMKQEEAVSAIVLETAKSTMLQEEKESQSKILQVNEINYDTISIDSLPTPTTPRVITQEDIDEMVRSNEFNEESEISHKKQYSESQVVQIETEQDQESWEESQLWSQVEAAMTKESFYEKAITSTDVSDIPAVQGEQLQSLKTEMTTQMAEVSINDLDTSCDTDVSKIEIVNGSTSTLSSSSQSMLMESITSSQSYSESRQVEIEQMLQDAMTDVKSVDITKVTADSTQKEVFHDDFEIITTDKTQEKENIETILEIELQNQSTYISKDILKSDMVVDIESQLLIDKPKDETKDSSRLSFISNEDQQLDTSIETSQTEMLHYSEVHMSEYGAQLKTDINEEDFKRLGAKTTENHEKTKNVRPRSVEINNSDSIIADRSPIITKKDVTSTEEDKTSLGSDEGMFVDASDTELRAAAADVLKQINEEKTKQDSQKQTSKDVQQSVTLEETSVTTTIQESEEVVTFNELTEQKKLVVDGMGREMIQKTEKTETIHYPPGTEIKIPGTEKKKKGPEVKPKPSVTPKKAPQKVPPPPVAPKPKSKKKPNEPSLPQEQAKEPPKEETTTDEEPPLLTLKERMALLEQKVGTGPLQTESRTRKPKKSAVSSFQSVTSDSSESQSTRSETKTSSIMTKSESSAKTAKAKADFLSKTETSSKSSKSKSETFEKVSSVSEKLVSSSKSLSSSTSGKFSASYQTSKAGQKQSSSISEKVRQEENSTSQSSSKTSETTKTSSRTEKGAPKPAQKVEIPSVKAKARLFNEPQKPAPVLRTTKVKLEQDSTSGRSSDDSEMKVVRAVPAIAVIGEGKGSGSPQRSANSSSPETDSTSGSSRGLLQVSSQARSRSRSPGGDDENSTNQPSNENMKITASEEVGYETTGENDSQCFDRPIMDISNQADGTAERDLTGTNRLIAKFDDGCGESLAEKHDDYNTGENSYGIIALSTDDQTNDITDSSFDNNNTADINKDNGPKHTADNDNTHESGDDKDHMLCDIAIDSEDGITEYEADQLPESTEEGPDEKTSDNSVQYAHTDEKTYMLNTHDAVKYNRDDIKGYNKEAPDNKHDNEDAKSSDTETGITAVGNTDTKTDDVADDMTDNMRESMAKGESDHQVVNATDILDNNDKTDDKTVETLNSIKDNDEQDKDHQAVTTKQSEASGMTDSKNHFSDTDKTEDTMEGGSDFQAVSDDKQEDNITRSTVTTVGFEIITRTAAGRADDVTDVKTDDLTGQDRITGDTTRDDTDGNANVNNTYNLVDVDQAKITKTDDNQGSGHNTIDGTTGEDLHASSKSGQDTAETIFAGSAMERNTDEDGKPTTTKGEGVGAVEADGGSVVPSTSRMSPHAAPASAHGASGIYYYEEEDSDSDRSRSSVDASHPGMVTYYEEYSDINESSRFYDNNATCSGSNSGQNLYPSSEEGYVQHSNNNQDSVDVTINTDTQDKIMVAGDEEVYYEAIGTSNTDDNDNEKYLDAENSLQQVPIVSHETEDTKTDETGNAIEVAYGTLVTTEDTDESRELAEEHLYVVAGHIPSGKRTSGATAAAVATYASEKIAEETTGSTTKLSTSVSSASARASSVASGAFALASTISDSAVEGSGDASVIVCNKVPAKPEQPKSPSGKKSKKRLRGKRLPAGSMSDSGFSEGSASDASTSASSTLSMWSGESSTSELIGASGVAAEAAGTAAASTASSLDIVPEETVPGELTEEFTEYVTAHESGDISIITLPYTDESYIRRRLVALAETRLSRACCCALPLQALMILLLGVACLVPMAEEEFGCALANNLHSSLAFMLKYTDGPPPF